MEFASNDYSGSPDGGKDVYLESRIGAVLNVILAHNIHNGVLVPSQSALAAGSVRGSIYLYAENVTFLDNTSQRNGGAFHMFVLEDGDNEVICTFVRCQFIDNTASNPEDSGYVCVHIYQL